jgi:hypothetical protein
MDQPVKIIQISTNSIAEGNVCLYGLDSNGQVWEMSWTREGYKWDLVGSPFNI